MQNNKALISKESLDQALRGQPKGAEEIVLSGPSLQQFKDDLAQSLYDSTVADSQKSGRYLQCREPALSKCYSAAGRKEFAISGLCEKCFDALFLQ